MARGGGAPTCGRGVRAVLGDGLPGEGRRGWLTGWRGSTWARLPAWRGRRRAWRPACSAVAWRGRRRAWPPSRRLGAAAAARAREEEGRGGSYIRLCRAMDQGAGVPRQDRWRGRALPRLRSALLVAATSALCSASMYGAAWAFGRVRAIGAAKSVSFEKKNHTARDTVVQKKQG